VAPVLIYFRWTFFAIVGFADRRFDMPDIQKLGVAPNEEEVARVRALLEEGKASGISKLTSEENLAEARRRVSSAIGGSENDESC
jgi:L-2-hydroxyglutarate oxidase LhgO